MNDDGVKAVIIETFGMDAWTVIQAKLGGMEFNIPSQSETLGDGHYLVVSVGRVLAEALVENFGGEPLYVPKGRKEMDISPYLRLMDDGLNNAEIGRRLGVSERSVRRTFQEKIGRANPNRKTAARFPGVERLTPKEQERREKVYKQLLAKQFTSRSAAASRLGISLHRFEKWIKAYEATTQKVAPAVSNGGLTALGPSGRSPSPRNHSVPA